MLKLLNQSIQFIQPLIVPICFILAWGLIILLGLTLWNAMRYILIRGKQMHAIPCPHCQYFTNNHRLKCTVQPTLANTEKAITCSDYRRSQHII